MNTKKPNTLNEIYRDLIRFGIILKDDEIKYVRKCLYQAFLTGKIEGLTEGKKVLEK